MGYFRFFLVDYTSSVDDGIFVICENLTNYNFTSQLIEAMRIKTKTLNDRSLQISLNKISLND